MSHGALESRMHYSCEVVAQNETLAARPPRSHPAGGPYVASSSETHPSRKRRKPLPSRLGLATQWPQGEA